MNADTRRVQLERSPVQTPKGMHAAKSRGLPLLLLSLLVFAGSFPLNGCSRKRDVEKAKAEMREILGDKGAAIAEAGSIVFMPLQVDQSDEVQPLEGTGPNGEAPVGIEALEKLLTDEDAAKLRGGGFTAAICFHYTAADWPQLQLQGCRATLEKYGVKLIAVTDGQLKIDKQIADYETVIEMKPDLIITIPLDRDATAPVLRKAVNRGIVLSFMDTVPSGFQHPRDYAGMATADNYANGRVGIEMLAERLGGKGKVALLHLKYSMFHTDQRSQAARETLQKYPGIKVVAEQSIENPEEAASVAESLLIAHPDLDGMWTVWDGPGMAVAGVINNLGRKTAVTTVDLSYDSAYSIASGGLLIGTGAQHPYDQGVAETLIGLAALLGKTPPAYVLIPGEKVTRKSMKRSWYRVFRREMPAEIRAALER